MAFYWVTLKTCPLPGGWQRPCQRTLPTTALLDLSQPPQPRRAPVGSYSTRQSPDAALPSFPGLARGVGGQDPSQSNGQVQVDKVSCGLQDWVPKRRLPIRLYTFSPVRHPQALDTGEVGNGGGGGTVLLYRTSQVCKRGFPLIDYRGGRDMSEPLGQLRHHPTDSWDSLCYCPVPRAEGKEPVFCVQLAAKG